MELLLLSNSTLPGKGWMEHSLPEGHKGETREQRIREVLVVAPELTVIGLPEGNWIKASEGQAVPGGPNTTYVFRASEVAVTLEAGHRF